MAASTTPACDCATAIMKYVTMCMEKLPSHLHASFIYGQFSQLVHHVRMQTDPPIASRIDDLDLSITHKSVKPQISDVTWPIG